VASESSKFNRKTHVILLVPSLDKVKEVDKGLNECKEKNSKVKLFAVIWSAFFHTSSP